MADISRIQVGNTTYNMKDSRQDYKTFTTSWNGLNLTWYKQGRICFVRVEGSPSQRLNYTGSNSSSPIKYPNPTDYPSCPYDFSSVGTGNEWIALSRDIMGDINASTSGLIIQKCSSALDTTTEVAFTKTYIAKNYD